MTYRYNPETFEPHYDWYESAFDDAKAIGALMGWQIDNISFSGFWSQGDGASFTGTLGYAKGCARAVRDYAPLDTELHDIAARWQSLQKPHLYRYTAHVERSSHRYSHENTVSISDSYIGGSRYYGPEVPCATDDMAIDIARDFMRWIYRQLEREYDYQHAWQMAQRWNDCANEATDAKGCARAALADYRATMASKCAATLPDSVKAAAKRAIRTALQDMADAIDERATIADNFHYDSVTIDQFAADNI